VISLTCDACGKKLQIRDEFAGQTGQCPACGFTLQIPIPAMIVEEPLLTSRAVEVRNHVPPPREPDSVEPPAGAEPLLDHGGGPIAAGADFFVPVPPEIGPLRSAHTTLRQGQEPMLMGARLLSAGLAACGGVLVGVIINAMASVSNEFWQCFWPIALSLIAFGITMALTRFNHTCSYVGQEGVARFVCTGSRDNLSTQEVFHFRDAADLRVATTQHYAKGSYQNTSYRYTWNDINNQPRYVISGTHNSEAGTPPSSDPFHYARAAETEWTVYLLADAKRLIEKGNKVQFKLTGAQWIRLGPGLIMFNNNGQPEEWRVEEIRGATIQKGVVRILRNDAKEGWFSSKGVFKFSFDQLANAQVFTHMMETIVGVPVL
jgi:hypothetical protein